MPEAMGNAWHNIRIATSGTVVTTIRWAGDAARMGKIRHVVLMSLSKSSPDKA
jgi:hypothetical protein